MTEEKKLKVKDLNKLEKVYYYLRVKHHETFDIVFDIKVIRSETLGRIKKYRDLTKAN